VVLGKLKGKRKKEKVKRKKKKGKRKKKKGKRKKKKRKRVTGYTKLWDILKKYYCSFL
jgi:hypothetical protein